jgi:hypothetical protein
VRGSPAAALICDSLVVERLDGLTERVLWAVLEYPDPIRRREPGQIMVILRVCVAPQREWTISNENEQYDR